LGLYVLFFTELWERFSFYGMKTLLMLYLLNYFMWDQERASSLMGWYVAAAYGLPVMGGFIADRFLGAKRAVIVGAILLSIGHLTMVMEPLPYFYAALILIVVGVGFLKPNISTQVGKLYPPGDPRRDGAFTIFYMGINLGALAGPFVCDWLRTHKGYHWGFGAAGVGMIFGLIVYVIGQRKLVEFQDEADGGGAPAARPTAPKAPAVELPAHVIRDRILVLVVVFVFVIFFWAAFEQMPNVILKWADKHTNLLLFSAEPPPVPLAIETGVAEPLPSGIGSSAITSGMSQSFNPFFIITLAPIFAFLWVWLDRRKLQPSTPAKMVLGLFLMAIAYSIMLPVAVLENRPSSADLVEVPAGVDLNKYGHTRLRYNAVEQSLRMDGVLTDVDRLNLLADSASDEFRKTADALVTESVERLAIAEPARWPITKVVSNAPEGFSIEGTEAQKVLSWDPSTKTLNVTGEIKDRARVELLASAAVPQFKAAVDSVYIDSSNYRISVWWLILFFLFLTMGELCISPVGLSLVTKLAPPGHVGIFMGGWFLATAIAGKSAHMLGGSWDDVTPIAYFRNFVIVCAVGALLMAILIKPLKRMMHEVQ
jgi:POT family proton-dependent oligopeptide transporter